MRILYYDNCWFTNVGEAFIDIGSMQLLREVLPNGKIACCSNMSEYYCSQRSKKVKSSDDSYKSLGCDYFVLSGMMATIGHITSREKEMVSFFKKQGAKIIYLGLGSGEYSETEKKEFANYLEYIRPDLIMTRDEYTYDSYKDVAKCIKGLDCAFWVRDTFDPRGFCEKKYRIVTFNRSEEPAGLRKELQGITVVRPWHMQYAVKEENIGAKTMISDSPYDYLTLYANAETVYTDLVHATIVSLMYETPVKYWYVDRRIETIEMINGLKKDEGWLSVDYSKLHAQKADIVSQIKKELKV